MVEWLKGKRCWLGEKASYVCRKRSKTLTAQTVPKSAGLLGFGAGVIIACLQWQKYCSG